MPDIALAGSAGSPITLKARMANRHGLIAGATGTGKTFTLKLLAEQFSAAGVPVFLADVKGDLSSLAKTGEMSTKLSERLSKLNLPEPAFSAYPTLFWDVYGEQGHPVRTTLSEMGPLILSELLGLNDTQTGVINIVFRVADDNGWLLLDLDDLRTLLAYVSDHKSELQTTYGSVSPASVGAIQRSLLSLEDQGAREFFGEPALSLDDFMQTDTDGRGYISVLATSKLMLNPKLYSCFLLWMLSEIFELLPEVGDLDKPKLVFFFDEAHLLFENINPALEQKIEQVVRLIRSKGVGIYFVTQTPADIPDDVLGQLGNRVQHALRAFTPRDQKAVKVAAQTFRANPDLDTETAIMELGVGEALISCLDEKGSPSMVQRAWMRAPGSAFSPISETERAQLMATSIVAGAYDEPINRESAHEILSLKTEQAQAEAVLAQKQIEEQKLKEAAEADQLKAEAKAAIELEKAQLRAEADAARAALKEAQDRAKAAQKKADEEAKAAQKKSDERAKLLNRVVGNFASSAARSLGSKTGQTLLRGVLGSLLKR
jgi:DNA helicase HerA-like ATPase